MTPSGTKIPANVRTMIAIVASPTLLVIYFLLHSIWMGNWSEIGISTLLFSVLACLAYFIVITGRLPFSRHKKVSPDATD